MRAESLRVLSMALKNIFPECLRFVSSAGNWKDQTIFARFSTTQISTTCRESCWINQSHSWKLSGVKLAICILCFACSLNQPKSACVLYSSLKQSDSLRLVLPFVILFVLKRNHFKVRQKALNTNIEQAQSLSLPVNSKQLRQDKVNSLTDPVGGHLS